MPGLSLFVLLLFGVSLIAAPPSSAAQAPDVRLVIQHCHDKNRGRDQRGRLLLRMRNDSGRVTRKREFIRLWKDYGGHDGIVSKVMLFTVAPPEYRGDNYLRVDYTVASGRPAEQWVYLKRLQAVRRLSAREQDQLGWGLIGEDLMPRQYEEDTHVLLSARETHGHIAYEVESRPRREGAPYERYVSYFSRPDDWRSCVLTHRDYYDARGRVVKRADFTWQRVGRAWVLDTLEVVRERPRRQKGKPKKQRPPLRLYVTYRLTVPEVDVGLEEDDFSQRRLRRGIR